MNRWLVAMVVGLMAVGCAEGVEDPEPAPEAPVSNPHVAPAQTPLSGEIEQAPNVTEARIGSKVSNLPKIENQPFPKW